MPHRFRKLHEIVHRVQRARTVATAIRLAGESSGGAKDDLYWPDLVHVLEDLLPSLDELGAALDDIHRPEETAGA